MEHAGELERLRDTPGAVTLAIGAFDGLHRGHQALLKRAREEAVAHGGDAWALTFDPHPLRVLRPDQAPDLLTSTPHKLRLLDRTGMAGCVVMPFTPALARWSPARFVDHLATCIPRLQEVVVGTNWRFGRGGQGNVEKLRASARAHGFAVHAMEPVVWGDEAISSTRIRQAITGGDLEAAEHMLGRPFSVLGRVVRGAQVGRELGFPTANINPENEVRPPPGIYAARADVDGTSYDGAAYLAGPASPSRERAEVEIYLLDVSLELYDRDLEVFFLHKIREDRRFSSREDLRQQIARDIAAARNLLATR